MRHYSERALLTDFYELTMLRSYFLNGMNNTAVFEFFVRHLPPVRNFLMACGLAQVVDSAIGDASGCALTPLIPACPLAPKMKEGSAGRFVLCGLCRLHRQQASLPKR